MNKITVKEFEDFLGEYGFESIDELKKLINEDTERMRSVLDHENELKSYMKRWEKLKEYVKHEIKITNEYFGCDNFSKEEQNILDRMQELKKESKDDRED